MIAIGDLLTSQSLLGNYFASDTYLTGDFESGLIENRAGLRFLALPETLIQGIYAGLDQELGSASGVVLFNCGRWWGKNFYTRFVEEISEYYNKSIAEMEMVELLQCLKQCWKTHGWGTFNLDMEYHQQGFLVVQNHNSPFAEAAPASDRPVCFLEAGILSAFFSQLTGRQLHCVQTSCESLGADCNYFILGLAERLKPVEGALAEQQNHQAIIERLKASTVAN